MFISVFNEYCVSKYLLDYLCMHALEELLPSPGTTRNGSVPCLSGSVLRAQRLGPRPTIRCMLLVPLLWFCVSPA